MAKRFTATEIWNEDWFLDMPNEYKLFWYYMLSNSNHAGLFKVNLRSFCGQIEVKVGSKEILSYFNAGKQRIRVINDSLWLIEDFFVYQYGPTLNPKNRVHESIVKEYLKHGINLTSIRGLKDLKDGVKDKDKDKDIVFSLNTNTVKEFNTMPKPENFNGLPEYYKTISKELVSITKRVTLPDEDIERLWEVFKIKNLTGKRYYDSDDKVYSHFVDWVKKQEFKEVPKSNHEQKILTKRESAKGKTES